MATATPAPALPEAALTPPSTSPEFSLLLAVCQWPPSPQRTARLLQALENPLDWEEFLRLVKRHRIDGLAHAALSQAPIGSVPQTVRDHLKKKAQLIARQGLLAASESAKLTQRLQQANIPCLILKGAPLAVLAYQSVALRQSRDTDLLVSPHHLLRADAILRAAGFERYKPDSSLKREHLRFFIRNRSQAEYLHPESGQRAELHVRLQDNPAFGTMHDPDLALPLEVDLGGGIKVNTLNQADLLPYLCVHGAKHAWFRLKWLADVGAILAHNPGAASQLLIAAHRQGTERAAMQALLLCNRFWDLALPPEMPRKTSTPVERLSEAANSALGASMNNLWAKDQSAGNNPVRLSFLLFSGHPVRLFRAIFFEVFVSNDVERLPSRIQFLHPVLRFPTWVAEKTTRPRWLITQGFERRNDLWLLARAVGWLFFAWLVITALPGKLYRKCMTPKVRGSRPQNEDSKRFIGRVSWAVQAAAKRVPWRAVCFHEGIAAQHILCRSGVAAELCFGVAKSNSGGVAKSDSGGVAQPDSKGLEAHVWVTAQGLTVVGGSTKDRFTTLGIFAEKPEESIR